MLAWRRPPGAASVRQRSFWSYHGPSLTSTCVRVFRLSLCAVTHPIPCSCDRCNVRNEVASDPEKALTGDRDDYRALFAMFKGDLGS
jgi:hypothetical protein